jgi:predicted nucleic acid-binding protein
MYRLIKDEPEFEIVGFGFEILDEAIRIEDIKEIHDRIIAATAKFYQVGVLTKDRIISESGEIKTLSDFKKFPL